jgi:hypothetical protein
MGLLPLWARGRDSSNGTVCAIRVRLSVATSVLDRVGSRELAFNTHRLACYVLGRLDLATLPACILSAR